MRRNLLTVAACGLLLLPHAHAQQAGESIAGRVVSARDDHPLVHAKVTLVNVESEHTVATETTDGEGRFHFDPVPAGKYRLTGTMPNYSTAAYMQHEGYSTAIVTGAGLATGSLELRLTPVASITGRVFDGVEPVQHANVMLYRQDPGTKGKATRPYGVQTDDEGMFEIERVGAGTYFLSVSGTPWYAVHPPVDAENAQPQYRVSVDPSLDVAYPMVFYPDALDAAEATPIEIRGGEQIRANLQLRPVHAVTMTVRTPQTGQPNGIFEQLTRIVFGVEEPVMAQMSRTGDGWRFAGLAPGEYSVREFSGGMTAGLRTVDLREGSSTIDEAAPVEAATVTVTAHTADGSSLPGQVMVSLRGSLSSLGPGTRLNDNGSAEIPRVPAGTYRVEFNGIGQRLHVVSLSVGGKPIGDGRVSIAGTEPVAVDATVTSALVTIEGVVHREGKPAAAVFVVLVPAGGDMGEELFRRDQSDLDGSFTFKNVSPGNYIVFASDDVGALHWTETETLEPYLLHGAPVSVPASDKAVIHLSAPVNVQAR